MHTTAAVPHFVLLMHLLFIPQSVCALFWSIYAMDREHIYPERLDKTIPFILNHYWHTGIVLTAIIEAMVVFHRYPSNFKAFVIMSLTATLYIVWMTWVFTATGKWPYPFLEKIPLPLFPVFCLFCLVVDVVFYFIGKLLCHIRWRGNNVRVIPICD